MWAILQPTGADYRDIQLLVDSPARGLLVQWGLLGTRAHGSLYQCRLQSSITLTASPVIHLLAQLSEA